MRGARAGEDNRDAGTGRGRRAGPREGQAGRRRVARTRGAFQQETVSNRKPSRDALLLGRPAGPGRSPCASSPGIHARDSLEKKARGALSSLPLRRVKRTQGTKSRLVTAPCAQMRESTVRSVQNRPMRDATESYSRTVGGANRPMDRPRTQVDTGLRLGLPPEGGLDSALPPGMVVFRADGFDSLAPGGGPCPLPRLAPLPPQQLSRAVQVHRSSAGLYPVDLPFHDGAADVGEELQLDPEVRQGPRSGVRQLRLPQ